MKNLWKRASRAPLAAGLALALGLALAACGSGGGAKVADTKAPTDGVLRLGFLQDPGQPPDPDVFYAGSGLALTTNLYEGLVKYQNGSGTKLVPSLATSWEANKTNTVFTFHLRKGVTFHDGTPFTSAAVEASFERRLAVAGGPAYMAEGVKSFATPDDYTSVITLKQPNSAFLDELASPYGPRMMSPTGLKKYAGKDHAQTYLESHDLGTGPYTLTVAKVDDRYQMKAYPKYWGTKGVFKTVDFGVYKDTSSMQLALNNGDLAAIIGAVPSAAQASYAKQDKIKVYSLPTFQIGVLYMNPHRPFLKTAAARKALFEAIDWESIIKQNLPQSNVLATGAYPDGSLPDGVAPVKLTHDTKPLEDYVASLPKGTKVDIGVQDGGEDDQQIAEIIAAQLQAMGLDATVSTHQTSEVFGQFQSHPQQAPDVMVNAKTWPDASNPYLYGHIFWDPTGGLNFTACSSAAISKYLAEGLKTGSEQAYAKAAEAEQKAMCNPIWSYAHDFVVAQPWLGNVAQSHSIAEPYTLDFNTLTIEK